MLCIPKLCQRRAAWHHRRRALLNLREPSVPLNAVQRIHTSVAFLLVDHLESRGVIPDGLDGRERFQNDRNRLCNGSVERIFFRDSLPGKRLLHVVRGEEGPQRVGGILMKAIRHGFLEANTVTYPWVVSRQVAHQELGHYKLSLATDQ